MPSDCRPVESHARPRLVVAGTHSGVGKTTVTLALMAALRRHGYDVQGFKAGPDYIDGSYHAAVTGRTARNLDAWMTGADGVRELFWRASADADISVIEGVMGLYDGSEAKTETGSTAQLAKLLNAPVLLVIDASAMARSAAAVVLGFQQFDPSLQIAGVLANRVAGEGHFGLIREAVEDACHIPVMGYLAPQQGVGIAQRHLGLVPAVEQDDLTRLFDRLAEAMEDTVPLERVIAMAGDAAPVAKPQARIFLPPGDVRSIARVDVGTRNGSSPARVTAGMERVPMAVARDAAFNFYYAENLELLAWHGARLMEFSPLAGESIPEDACALYIGGGFPEEFAARLSSRCDVLASIRQAALAGMPMVAECGGLMFLTRSITDRSGTVYPMAGVLPARVEMTARLTGFGYREATPACDNFLLAPGEFLRGHEFHYSSVTYESAVQPLYQIDGPGERTDGVCAGNVLASYVHLHLASNPHLAPRFVAAARSYRAQFG